MSSHDLCAHDHRRTFLDLGSTPLADEFPTSLDVSQVHWPLRLSVCERCFMVQLQDQVPDHDLFGEDYGFFSGSSPALVRHFDEYATWVKQTFPAFDTVFEIACNDGTLLRHFDDGHTQALGVDPAGPPTALARDNGLYVDTAPFTANYAQRIAPNLPTNRLVIANNVIAHVPDLEDFVAGLSIMVGNDGVGVLEFQYLPDLLLGNQFDLVYHEHRRFLSVTSLLPVLRHHDLDVVHVRSIDTQGGSLRIVVRRLHGNRSTVPYVLRLESWLCDISAYTSLQGRVDYVRYQLARLLGDEQHAGRTLALYGAPAKATTLLHYAGLTHDTFEYAVDLTPRKIGRYMPGTDIPIISPEQERTRHVEADTYLLAVPNYASSVLRRERDFVEAGGRFVVATPRPVVL